MKMLNPDNVEKALIKRVVVDIDGLLEELDRIKITLNSSLSPIPKQGQAGILLSERSIASLQARSGTFVRKSAHLEDSLKKAIETLQLALVGPNSDAA